jgi:hypothetical protein
MHFQIEAEREKDGRWIAEAPDLTGVMVYGDDRGLPWRRSRRSRYAF